MSSVPRPPPVPVILPPHEEESWAEYHKGARYSVSLVGVGVLALLVVLVIVVAATTHSTLVTGLVGVGAAVVLFWALPKMLRSRGD